MTTKQNLHDTIFFPLEYLNGSIFLQYVNSHKSCQTTLDYRNPDIVFYKAIHTLNYLSAQKKQCALSSGSTQLGL